MNHYACGICNTKCHGRRYIACGNLTKQNFSFLKKVSLSYLCSRCVYCPTSKQYNYDVALQHLSAAISQHIFDEAARLERIFLRYESRVVVSSDHANHNNLFRDHVAHQLFGSNWSGDTHITVNTNVNCLFRALAVDLYGHQKASSEIRLKTCMKW
jgi:hypothetical protein